MRKRLTFRGVDMSEGAYSEWEEDSEGRIIGMVGQYLSTGELLSEITGPATGEQYVEQVQARVRELPVYKGMRLELTEV